MSCIVEKMGPKHRFAPPIMIISATRNSKSRKCSSNTKNGHFINCSHLKVPVLQIEGRLVRQIIVVSIKVQHYLFLFVHKLVIVPLTNLNLIKRRVGKIEVWTRNNEQFIFLSIKVQINPPLQFF